MKHLAVTKRLNELRATCDELERFITEVDQIGDSHYWIYPDRLVRQADAVEDALVHIRRKELKKVQL